MPDTPAFYLRLEYTTFEVDGDDFEELCSMVPRCPSCGGSSDGSGSSGGSSPAEPPPYVGPCTCPDGYSLTLVGVDEFGNQIYKCKHDIFGNIRLCNEDPLNNGGGDPSPSDPLPLLQIELTEFDVPGHVVVVSTRFADVGFCEPCAEAA